MDEFVWAATAGAVAAFVAPLLSLRLFVWGVRNPACYHMAVVIGCLCALWSLTRFKCTIQAVCYTVSYLVADYLYAKFILYVLFERIQNYPPLVRANPAKRRKITRACQRHVIPVRA